MKRLHAPNEFFRIRRLRQGMRAREELWRLLADGPRRLASREGDDGDVGPFWIGRVPVSNRQWREFIGDGG